MALLAKNLMRSETGRAFMAVRDMDVAASVIGIPMMKTKLLAFAISSFYCGVAGALYAFCYLGTVEPEAFTLDLSFRILFMVIIGGVGSILGCFLGAAFITLFPIFLNLASGWLSHAFGIEISHATVSNLELIIFGGLIIFFLIVEPQRPGPPVADRQGEAAPLAVPALTGLYWPYRRSLRRRTRHETQHSGHCRAGARRGGRPRCRRSAKRAVHPRQLLLGRARTRPAARASAAA